MFIHGYYQNQNLRVYFIYCYVSPYDVYLLKSFLNSNFKKLNCIKYFLSTPKVQLFLSHYVQDNLFNLER